MRSRKNAFWLSILIAIPLITTAFTVSVAEADPTTVSIVPASLVNLGLGVGEQFTVNVTVTDVTDLWGYSFELRFNPDVIHGVSVKLDGDLFLGSEGNIVMPIPGKGWDNTIGRLWKTGAGSYYTTPDKCPDGSGVLSMVTFNVTSLGDSELHFVGETGVKDYTGAWIPSSLEHGYFRNVETYEMPTASFNVTGGSVPLEGYYTKFNGTSSKANETMGRNIDTYKWYFWKTFRDSLDPELLFPTSVFRPDGDGTCTDWTHPVRVGNYTEWDDATADSDMTYVRATANNMYESSTLTGHTTEIWPVGTVRVIARVRANVSTDDKVRLVLVIGGTKYEAPTAHALTTIYSNYKSNWEMNPATEKAWTWSDIDALEAGVKSEAVGEWVGEIRVTQLYVEVIAASIVTGTDAVLNQNYTMRGTWPVTLTVIDNVGVVGTTTVGVKIYAHDIFFTGITTNTTVGQYPHANTTDIGKILQVNVTAINEGDFTETFNATCFWRVFYLGEYQVGLIGVGTKYDITLDAGATTTLTFYWDTEGRNLTQDSTFTIHANASVVPYEFDKERGAGKIEDNEYISAPIRIRFHDVRVQEVTPTIVKPGQVAEMKVTVVNDGDYNETSITVTLYNGTDVIPYNETHTSAPIPYMENKSTPGYYKSWKWVAGGKWEDDNIDPFYWNTTGVPPGLYTIKATATVVPGDYEPHDNTYSVTVYVVIPGDIDKDRDVDSKDFYWFSGAYGTTVEDPTYNREADLDLDDDIDSYDFYIFAGNYGKHV